ncbi:MAG: protoporphyrinogen oxidase [Thermoguttaceae bacterium]|jgi:oxygen-dependent protoporphyrinogen oxidase
MSDSTAKKIAVIGGGIAGLAAASRLVELAGPAGPTLFEAGPRLGGVVSTIRRDGFQIEQSADNFITTVPWGLALCRRLGLGDQIIQTNPNCRRTFVVRHGRLCRLPDGFLMMAPTQIWPLAVTPILSPLGKLRAALEYFIPPRRGEEDESMAHFVRRRLGREVFQRLVEPLVGAVYAADMEKLSVEATLARFHQMERQYGSLIRAMRQERKGRRSAPVESGARYSMFVTLANGLSALVEALAARLPAAAVRLSTPVERIEQCGSLWRLRLAGGLSSAPPPTPPAEFDAVIVAAPAHVAAGLLMPVDIELAADLAAIEHSGTAIVSLGYDRRQIAHPLDGTGAVVPAIEQSPILACSFSSQKYPHRAPEGKTLLRVFVGGARRPELAEMPDDELCPLVLEHLAPLLGIRGEPVFCDVAHWPRTMPQYHVGHLARIARIEARLANLPGLQLAGNAYHGVGIPDCIHSGELAAERILGGQQ